MVSLNVTVAAVTRGSGTVLERVRVLGEKMFLSSKSEEGCDSSHGACNSSFPVGGGTRISWGRNRGLVPMSNGVPGRVSGVRPMSSSSSESGIVRAGGLSLDSSELILEKPPGPSDVPANQPSEAKRGRMALSRSSARALTS